MAPAETEADVPDPVEEAGQPSSPSSPLAGDEGDAPMPPGSIIFKTGARTSLGREWLRDEVDIAPFRVGDSSWEMTPEEFYIAVERPDLARRFQRRSTARSIMVPGGAVIGGAGVFTAFLSGSYLMMEYLFSGEVDRRALIVLGVGSGMTLAGGAFMITGLTMASHPTSLEERMKLAKSHNERLRATSSLSGLQLGLQF